jgi:dihydrodipicolinate reductase
MMDVEYTIDDFAYALAQLTDDCDLEWIRGTTGLSYDECEKIMRIAFAAQQRVFK